MNLKSILCIVLLITVSLAVSMRTKLNEKQSRQIEQLRSTKSSSWSKIIMNLAELQMMTSGPLDDLLEAIENLVDDLSSKMFAYQQDFNTSTNLHNSAVSQFTSDLTLANSNVSQISSYLNGVLIPKSSSLTFTIEKQERDLIESQESLEKFKAQRELSHTNWQARTSEHNEAISAINEGIRILSEIIIKSEQLSLLELKKSQSTLQVIEKRLSRKVDAVLARALVDIASSEYANQETIKKSINLLEQIKLNLSTSLEVEFSNEESELNSYNQSVISTTAHIIQVQELLESNRLDFESTTTAIQLNSDLLVTRETDLIKFQENLVAENKNYDNVTKSYREIESQIKEELSLAQSALSIVSSGDFSSNLSNRLNNREGSSQSANFQL